MLRSLQVASVQRASATATGAKHGAISTARSFTSRTASLSPSGGGQKHHTAPVVSKLFSPATHSVNENHSSMVVGKRLEQSILGGFSIAEQKARIELAAAYRMFAHMNWNEGILNHITVAIKEPDGSQAFLINPYGLRYDEVTASSLLKINLEGEILHAGVIGDIFGVNRAGFVIHGAIHRARGESATAIAHNHVPSITGLACTKTGFLSTLSQTSELCGESGSNKFEGLVTEEAMQKQLVQDLGDKDILVFQNHGILTTGRSVAQAWLTLYNLIRAAEIQVAAQSCDGVDGLILPSEETAHKTVNRMRTMTGMPYGEMEFAAYMRLMDKIDPSYRL